MFDLAVATVVKVYADPDECAVVRCLPLVPEVSLLPVQTLETAGEAAAVGCTHRGHLDCSPGSWRWLPLVPTPADLL